MHFFAMDATPIFLYNKSLFCIQYNINECRVPFFLRCMQFFRQVKSSFWRTGQKKGHGIQFSALCADFLLVFMYGFAYNAGQ